MFEIDLLQQLISMAGDGAAASAAASAQCDVVDCPAMAFTATAAALSTEGYFMQADILYYLRFGTYNAFAPLLYVCAAIGGMVSLAMGAPPRNYMWFFIGPAVYAWLIDSVQPVKGVRWAVAGVEQDQSEVWRLSEVGLMNSSLVKRQQGEFAQGQDQGPMPPWLAPIEVFKDQPPSGHVTVATPFLWVDEVTSGVAQWLTHWTGVYRSYGSAGGKDTNIAQAGSGVGGEGKWFLLSNLKWQILDSITHAQIHNAELRDAFATFMSTECGDLLASGIDHARLATYANTRGRNLDPSEVHTVFAKSQADSGESLRSTMGNFNRILSRQTIPTPRSVKNLLRPDALTGSAVTGENFAHFTPFFKEGKFQGEDNKDFESKISCPQYLWILIHGFRWEAAHIYMHLLRSAPGELNNNPEKLVHGLFYGWGIRKNGAEGSEGELLSNEELKHYLYNLILIHLIKNEMLIVRQVSNPRHLSGRDAGRFTEDNLKTIQSKNKYGELYSWAMMIPHIQGLLLYFLAAAYPFACVMVVVPGWHKTIFTWIAFYAWAKLWDVGFALVTVFERSLWASIGNNSDTAAVSTLVAEMAGWGSVNVCSESAETCAAMGNGTVMDVYNSEPISGLSGDAPMGAAPGGMQSYYFSLRTLDRAMMLAANLDLDLANGYYIYLLAGLYIAVPAIVGQIVLGAKSGVAGMIGQMFGSVASAGGSAAGSGFTSSFQTNAQQGQAALEQAAMAKAMRQQGLAHQAMAAGNKALKHGMEGAAIDSENRMRGEVAGGHGRTQQARSGFISAARTHAQTLGGWVSSAGDMVSSEGASKSGGAKSVSGGRLAAGGSVGAGLAVAAGALADANNAKNYLGAAHLQHSKIGANQPRAFSEGQMQAGARMQQERVGAAANFDAQAAVWEAKRDFGNHMAGVSAARGVFAGTFSPGQKPLHMEGMAMAGMLNSYGANGEVANDTKGEAEYGWNGFFGAVTATQSGLAHNPEYGNSQIARSYSPGDYWSGQGALFSAGAYAREHSDAMAQFAESLAPPDVRATEAPTAPATVSPTAPVETTNPNNQGYIPDRLGGSGIM